MERFLIPSAGHARSPECHETATQRKPVMHLLPPPLQAASRGSDCKLPTLLPGTQGQETGMETTGTFPVTPPGAETKKPRINNAGFLCFPWTLQKNWTPFISPTSRLVAVQQIVTQSNQTEPRGKIFVWLRNSGQLVLTHSPRTISGHERHKEFLLFLLSLP
jgi:hypothetical protein